jgi:hypothetical protein
LILYGPVMEWSQQCASRALLPTPLRGRWGPRLSDPPRTCNLPLLLCWCLDWRDPLLLHFRVLALLLPLLDCPFLVHPLQRAQQQTPWFEWHPIPAADDKPTDRTLPQPRRTPTPQELRGLGKGLRQGGYGATDARHRGLNGHLPVDPQRRGGTDRAGRVRQKRPLRLDVDVTPLPFESIGHDLAVLQQHELGIDGDIPPDGRGPPPHFRRDGAIA